MTLQFYFKKESRRALRSMRQQEIIIIVPSAFNCDLRVCLLVFLLACCQFFGFRSFVVTFRSLVFRIQFFLCDFLFFHVTAWCHLKWQLVQLLFSNYLITEPVFVPLQQCLHQIHHLLLLQILHPACQAPTRKLSNSISNLFHVYS